MTSTRYVRPLQPGDLVRWAGGKSPAGTYDDALGLVVVIMPDAWHFKVTVFWPGALRAGDVLNSHPYEALERV